MKRAPEIAISQADAKDVDKQLADNLKNIDKPAAASSGPPLGLSKQKAMVPKKSPRSTKPNIDVDARPARGGSGDRAVSPRGGSSADRRAAFGRSQATRAEPLDLDRDRGRDRVDRQNTFERRTDARAPLAEHSRHYDKANDFFNDLAREIKQQDRNINKALDFFARFDAYADRVLEKWELGLIFMLDSRGRGPLDRKEDLDAGFLSINEANQKAKAKQMAVGADIIEMSFLVSEIEMSREWGRAGTNRQLKLYSEYATKTISPQIEQLLNQIARDRDVSHCPAEAWDRIFRQGTLDCTKSEFSRILTHCRVQATSRDIDDMFDYFSYHRNATKINKIEFRQGMRRFTTFTPKYPNQPNPFLPSAVSQQPPQAQQYGQQPPAGQPLAPYGSQSTQPYGQQPTPYGQQPQQYGQQPPYGSQQTNLNASHHSQAPTYQPSPSQSGPQPDIEIDRIIASLQAYLDQSRKQFRDLFWKTQQYFDNTQTLSHYEFCQCLQADEREHRVSAYDQKKLADHFLTPSSRMPGARDQFVDMTLVENAFKNAGSQYDQVLKMNSHDLHRIRDALRKRFSGVFQWFAKHSRSGPRGGLTYDEFDRAISALNCDAITSYTRRAIFDGIDLQKRQQVTPQEIESLFKAFAKSIELQAFANVELVLQQIIKAFNGDDRFISNELMDRKRKTQSPGTHLPDEQFVDFFRQFERFTEFFTLEDIALVAEKFTVQFSEIDVDKFIQELVRSMTRARITRDPTKQGIHEGVQSRGPSNYRPLNSNHLMPDFSSDCTRASQGPRQPLPRDFRTQADSKVVEEVIKACYVQGNLIEDHFKQHESQGRPLVFEDFEGAIIPLQIDNAEGMRAIKALFDDVDINLNMGRHLGTVSAQQIDQYFAWHPTKRTIADMHDAQIDKICQSMQTQGIQEPTQLFQAIVQPYGGYSRGQQEQTCSLRQLEDVLMKLSRTDFSRSDVKFIAKKYTPGAADQVHYLKLQDDIRNRQNRSTALISNTSYGGKGANTIDNLELLAQKKLLTLNKSIGELFGRNLTAIVSIREFTDVFKDRLELMPTVNLMRIEELYRKLDVSNRQQVTVADIERGIISAIGGKDQFAILQDLFTDINRSTPNLARSMKANRHFAQDKGKMDHASFKDVLIANCSTLTEIDADFIIKFYDRGGKVQAQDFLMELTNPNLKPGTTFKDGNDDPNKAELDKLLGLINEQVALKQGSLNYEIGAEARGASEIDERGFFYCIDKYIRLKQTEKEILLNKYETGYRSNKINHTQFLEDLKEIQDDARDAKALTQPQEKVYKGICRMIENDNLSNLLAYNLKKNDRFRLGFITEQQLTKAINDTVALSTHRSAKSATSGKALKLNQSNTIALTTPLDRNGNNSLNYKQFLMFMFGKKVGRRLFDTDLEVLESLSKTENTGFSKTGSKMHTQVKNPENNQLGAIGENIIKSNCDIEKLFLDRFGADKTQTKISKEILVKVLESPQEANLTLSTDERRALQTWLQRNGDIDSNVSVARFLTAIGLPPLAIEGTHQQNVPKKVLDSKQLRDCQEFLNDLSHSLSAMGKQPESIVHKNKRSQLDKGVDPVTFKRILMSEIDGRLKPRLTDPFIMDLTAYLSSEEVGIISFKKLLQALNLSDNDPPLAQDGVEELREYQQRLKAKIDKAQVPFEVIDLNAFLKRESLSISQMFKLQGTQLNQEISVADFKKKMNEAGYVPKDPEKLIIALDTQGSRKRVSIRQLNQYIKELNSKNKGAFTKEDILTRMKGFDATVKKTVNLIEQWLKAPANNFTNAQLYELLDINRDGTVDKEEFCDGITRLGITNVTFKKCADVFDAIDINNNRFVSINEFSLFIEGATEKRDKRAHDLDEETRRELQQEIEQLFRQFDVDGSNTVSAVEIHKVMKSYGHQITMQRAQEMIQQVDRNGDNEIDVNEFEDLMMPIMTREIFQNEQHLNELRQMFIEADIDYSGFLSIDELYSCLKKQGINVEHRELIEMMQEFDNDRDAELDIDEFLAMMTMGDELTFRSDNAKNTFLKIKKGRKLGVMDFLKAFGSLPTSFSPSFFQERWQNQKNLPSSVFRAQIDPRTMMWKDILPVLGEELYGDAKQGQFKPKIRPFASLIASQITIEECTGVPLPKDGEQNFDRNSICKRAVRMGLFDKVKKDYIMNTAQVLASWDRSAEDVWKFSNEKQPGQNPVMFRTTIGDNLDPEQVCVIFELVIYVKIDPAKSKTIEMSCGWAEVPLNQLETEISKIKFEIKGGSPAAEVVIDAADVNTKRTGIKGFMKMITQNKVTSSIVLSFRPQKTFTPEIKFHMEMMPSTCFVQKKLLHFISAFRNYTGERLLSQRTLGQIKKPGGSVVISSLPRMLDNPDINEVINSIWQEDVMDKMTNVNQRKNIDNLIEQMKDFCHRLYPMLYSHEYHFLDREATHSACGDRAIMDKMYKLLTSALRFNKTGLAATKKAVEPPTTQTTFKPFNVHEIDFDVWDPKNEAESKQDRYINLYEQSGLLDPARHRMPQSSAQMMFGNRSGFNQPEQYANRAGISR